MTLRIGATRSRGKTACMQAMLFLLLCVAMLTSKADKLDELKAAVVKLTARSEGLTKVGTGFIISNEANTTYIVTASHVIAGDSAPLVEFFGRRNQRVKAEVVRSEGGDPRGLALLVVRGKHNVPSEARSLPFGSSDGLDGGEDVTMIGFGCIFWCYDINW